MVPINLSYIAIDEVHQRIVSCFQKIFSFSYGRLRAGVIYASTVWYVACNIAIVLPLWLVPVRIVRIVHIGRIVPLLADAVRYHFTTLTHTNTTRVVLHSTSSLVCGVLH